MHGRSSRHRFAVKSRLFGFWYRLISGLWFVPAAMVAGALVLWYAATAADVVFIRGGMSVSWVYSGGIQGARTILSVIASSTITVAGVVFSITMVALSQASSQFGPRLIKRFMQDRGTQIVLGTFVSAFAYCLLTLGTLRQFGGEDSVPQVAISVALAYAFAGIGVLVYFVHHVAQSIQADSIVESTAKDVIATVRRVFPEELGYGVETVDSWPAIPPDLEKHAGIVTAPESGFIDSISIGTIRGIAVKRDLVVKMEVSTGKFVTKGDRMALLWPAERAGQQAIRAVCSAFVIGRLRAMEQDIEFAIERLVQIAVRALSPGYNDPFTAIVCIQWLGTVLRDLARRRIGGPYWFDGQAKLRIITPPPGYAAFVNAAFDKIRHSAQKHAEVYVQLMTTMEYVAAGVRRPEDRTTLRQHIEFVIDEAQRNLQGQDLKTVKDRYGQISRSLA